MHPNYNVSEREAKRNPGLDFGLIKTKTRMAPPGYKPVGNSKLVNIHAACLPLNQDLPEVIADWHRFEEPLVVSFRNRTNKSSFFVAVKS